MRKYFLLSAVALLATSTANATTDYAEVTAKATIEVAGTLSCTNMDFGNIVVKQGNSEIVINYSSEELFTNSSDVIATEGETSFIACDGVDFYANEPSYPSNVSLTASGKAKALSLELSHFGDGFDGSLTIPADIEAGTYENSITITYTY